MIAHEPQIHYPISQNAFDKPLPGQQVQPTTEEAKHLATLEKMDFDYYNQRSWTELEAVYDRRLVTTYSDLQRLEGADRYLNDLQARVAFAPDVHTTAHLISFASGEWTATMSSSEGAFTKPMKASDGAAPIKPTGKRFRSITSIIAHWNDGVIDEQYVFFDSAALAAQIGIGGAPSSMGYGPDDLKPLFPAVGQAHGIYVIQKRLHAVDEMDFDVFARPHLDRLPETHADDIRVVWPDGHVTIGLERHEKDIEELFGLSPDLLIREHPVRLGAGDWTAMVGIMNGTFGGTIKDPESGKSMPGTGKKFRIAMSTFSHWVNGSMDVEYITYDMGAFARQIGIA